ncbi:SpaH/EbpB family LPXTG-anchored major pilin [Bifidobacterium adolescentis]|uniref:SpaH/EbpB family LPXTG-anchored major pilin n=1 Tax=Bifidobacterium adolescentis TaxID=1680 RepID=UPI00189A08CC|nr:SpaH/EbpB family LPXTG-anchored major pilin [Bifidobacterium adolescentis]MDB1486437.1 SpaH/EbpB family LPXTG-anchored major pilin [Bifidobacterium adolescentis]MDB1488135.1 SpaH/EbpB family LPXTG-anchored major pilin [Bifidobacterium adolescentis]MDB1491621.1 SpaH/EbpB family LPXTG-anchored major pilin [Bifidobacterium adolescentis]MDB1500434.1 SpaH/EbpB family LPXTG-anchored major pilin [Bifidobacterium adolescentis]
MNKVLKGLVAVAATAAMAVAGFAGAASATAAEVYTLTINNTETGHTYEAYQVFKGRLDSGTLSDIEWGTGVDGNALSTAKYDGKSAKEIAKSLNNTNAEAFANNVAGGNGTKSYLKDVTGSVEGETTQSKQITGLSAGYYLLKDTIDSTTAAQPAAFTKFILKVVGNVDVTPKTDTPSVEKKVKENSSKYTTDGGYGAGYNDVADYNIGDAVPFKLIGTVPNMDRYDTYTYTFNDTASNGLTLPSKDDVKVYVADDKAGTTKTDITTSADIAVKDQKLTVTFSNLKTVAGVAADKFIIVEYSATLNGEAEIGLPGNENAVKLTFSNNPNQSGQGGDNPQGETPEDKVIVFTYQLNGTKVDATDNKKKLKDAEFKLQRQSDNKWAQIANGKVTAWGDEAHASVVKSDDNGNFSVAGLDDGKYNVMETKAPAGYDLPANPFVITLTANTKNDQEWDGIPATALLDPTNGQFNETFKNDAGSNLPSTGGMGTVLLYVAGIAVFVLAGATLVMALRRRNA